MSAKTLTRIAVGLAVPCAVMAYLAQRQISKNFTQESYYIEAVELIKGYKPALERLGEPIYCKKPDISDEFNYQDTQIGRVKIPVIGQRRTADVMAYASKQDKKWNLDYMEIKYPETTKYKFYDSTLVKQKKSEAN